MSSEPLLQYPLSVSLYRSFDVSAADSSRQLTPKPDGEKAALVAEAIFEKCLQRSELRDPYKYARRTALTVSIVASLSANASYIPISLRLPNGAIFAISNFSAFFSLDYWAISATLNDLLGPKGKCEIVLAKHKNSNRCQLVATVTTSIAVALLSQIPIAIPSLDYDGAYKIPAFVALLAGGVLFPIRSLQLSIEQTIEMMKYSFKGVRKQVELIRKEAVALTDQYRRVFQQMEYSDKLFLIDSLKRDEEFISQVNSYILTVLETSINSPQSQRTPLHNRVSLVIGAWLTGSLQTALTIYTWSKTKEYLTDDNFTAGFFTTLVIGSGLYLSGKSIIETTQRMSASMINFFCRQNERTIADQLQPKLTFGIKLVGLLINGFALGPTLVIWGDFLKDHPSERLYFEISLCAAYFLLLSTATLEIAENVVEKVIQTKGDAEAQKIVLFHKGLLELQQIFSQSSLLDFSIFLTKAPATLRNYLLSKIGLSIEALDSYIKEISNN